MTMASSPTRKHVRKIDVRCETQKICHETKEAALDVAEMMMLQDKVEPGCHITPYECADCGFWHVANRRIVPVGWRWRK